MSYTREKKMRYLSENKIDAVNQIAAAICHRMCSSDKCGLCQLNQLRHGIEMALGDKMPVEEVVATMINNFRNTIETANAKYDRYIFLGEGTNG